MADGTFCDYSAQMDSVLMQHMAGFGGRGQQLNLGEGHGHQGANKGPGFYMDQFAGNMMSMSAAAESLGLSSASMQQPNADTLLALSMMSQTGSSAMMDNVINYAMKPEKGLPPTPPGSPDEPKGVPNPGGAQHSYHSNAHPASMVGIPSSIGHNLAKPVAMKRQSEKRPSHVRHGLSSPLSSSSSLDHQPLMESAMMGQEMNTSPTLARAIAAVQQTQKRPRSEKKAIPEEHKDNKYFERRKRNNNAAKKSRDARKAREDEIAIRASFLEKENAILRAQVTTLREEANSLRQLLLQKRSRH